MQKYNLDYEEVDVASDRANYDEMVRKSTQPLAPCVEIDGVMLADVSGEEVENYLLANDLVLPTDRSSEVSIDTGCSSGVSDLLTAKPIRFF